MEGRIESRTYSFTKALESSDQKLLTSLLRFTNDKELLEIKGSLESNKWILPCVCQKGFFDVLEIICDYHAIDIYTAEYKGKTCLQYACQEGHLKIVKWLLDHGADPKKSIWLEDSEFYLATLNGHLNIVNLLLSWQPDLAHDMSASYCLMYAACLGGNLDLVKRWYAPGINVNETIPFTSDLTKCEQKYPLFAACQEEHLEVAEFLIKECNATITNDLCKHFPKFTTQLIRSLFLVSDTKHQFEFCMRNYKIECLLPCWFSVKKKNYGKESGTSPDDEDDVDEENMCEVNIDVRENILKELPDGVLWTLRELTTLDASYNLLRTIPDALNPDSLTSNQIKTLNLSHCELKMVSPHIFSLPCLEQLNLSYNKLTYLSLTEENSTFKSPGWKCTRLQNLDVSHNLLISLPSSIQTCTNVTVLNASFNQMTTMCTPWQCPMKSLDLSDNKITAFAPSADQFWKQKLTRLNLHNNQLTELAESIVKMCFLTYLDVSNNKIQRLPAPNLWCCPLVFLNLNDNQLGGGRFSTRLLRVKSLHPTPVQQLEFPKACLSTNMMELFMANNGLKTVPTGISDMERLTVLDLSENDIHDLPCELGKLKKILSLKLEGITVKDKELQKLISSLGEGTDDAFASDVITYLEKKRRNCVHPDILKIVVLGCNNKNGPCIVQKLVKNKDINTHDHKNLTVTQLTAKEVGLKSLAIQIWEFPDVKVTSTLLPCFLTLNSLYIIVHDVCYKGTDLLSVSEKISSIQACVLRAKIIVVCTYSKSIEKPSKEKMEKEIMEQSKCRFPRVTFISLTLGPKENVDSLLQEINTAWETMNDAAFEKDVKLHQRQVPKQFLDVVSNVRKLQHNICRMDDFFKAVGCSRKDLEDGIDANLKLHEFLLQVGAMLHYNIHMDDLSDCVILNPTWLFRVFSKFLKSLVNLNDIKIAQLPIKDVRENMQEELPTGDYDYFPALLKILETFNIGMRIISSINKKDEILLVPSLLPKQPPQFQFDAHSSDCKAARLYLLPSISPDLWSHVISHLILAFERFSTSEWKLGERKSNASANLDRTQSFRMGYTSSLKGLNINNKNIQYWRTGIMMYHDQGHVVVEQVACISSPTAKPEPGILVIVQTSGNLETSEDLGQFNENTKKLSVMGIVRDELEEVLELFDPKFRDSLEAHMRQIYALCPHCHNISPGSGCVNLDKIHFRLRDCAQMLFSKDVIVCPKGPTLLANLVPEFLFLELPPKLHLSADDLVLSDVMLGHGMSGAVTKGIYKGTDVAVKIFHSSSFHFKDDVGSLYPNVAPFTATNHQSLLTKLEQDALETEQFKITNAFTEVRREVGILSKLNHEFIVTFIGICVRPKLLLVMELAPLGSLRKELEKRIKSTHNEHEQPDTVISQALFSKDLTYKIILQIGSGLSYLHKHNIIYRDLKPDNILIFSLSIDDRVNIKLSDYGISKFVTLQGATGLSGTVGYMAPEVVLKQPYTEQVDIYSYAIVMLEVLTGLSPIEKIHRPYWSNMIDNEAAPSHVQGYKIHTNFPYLEDLIKECWSRGMDERPSAENVVKRMKADQFLLLHDSVWLEQNVHEKLEVTCIYACQTFQRWNIWICESGYGTHRFLSVYDIKSCSFTLYRQKCNGPPVVDMTKVGSRIWVVCKELDNLQVIVRGTQNKFEVCHGVLLEGRATKIMNHVFGTSEESESFILVGLEDGCVTAYHFNTCQRKSISVITNLELHRGIPIAQMCSVSSNVIAVACGMTIYLLQVGLPYSQEANNFEKANKNCILIPDLVNYGSISLKNVIDFYGPVVCMIPEGNAVWCALQSSSSLVKVDVDNKKILLVLTLSWEAVQDTVIIGEIPTVSGSHSRKAASESESPSRNVELPLLGESTSATNEDTRQTHDSSHRHSESGSEDFQNHKPPVPPRININNMKKSHSLSELSREKPPPIPKRELSPEIPLCITSLCLSVDILIVGMNRGGIVLIPIIYNQPSDTSGNVPTLPFHLPVLKHPEKKKEPGRRTKSFTALPHFDQVSDSTTFISTLTLANDKLVSLHSVQQQLLRDPSRSRLNNVSSKREGSMFTPETIESFHFVDGNSLSSTDPTDFHGSTSDTLQSSFQNQVADIAIWDNVTQERLKIIRSFGHDLVNCCGWCCNAPDRTSKATASN